MRASCAPLNSLAILLCLLLSVQALETADVQESARRMAGEANDYAISLEARQEALRQLEEAVHLFLSVDETVEAARVLNRVGRLQLVLHQPQEALKSHFKALAYLEKTPAREVEVDSLNGLGAAYLVLKEKEKVEEVLQKSLSLSEQSGYTLGKAQALLTLSDRQNYDQHVKALQTAQKALALWLTLNDKRGLARTYSQIGRCYLAQNILPEAEENYQRALAIWRDLNYPPEQAEALIMLGFIEFRKSEWQSTISILTQAQSLLDENAEPEKMGEVTVGLADAFNETGLPENGLIQYERALSYFSQVQDPHHLASVTWGLGVTHYLLKEYPEAITHLEQAQVMAAASKDILVAAQCYEYLGRVYSDTEKPALALQNLQTALNIYTQTVNPKEAAEVNALMGQVAEQQGQLGRAHRYYNQALRTFTAMSDRLNQATVYYALGRLKLKTKNYKTAEDYLKRSLKVTETIRPVSTSSDLTAAFSATIYERYEKYIECLMRQHERQPTQGLAIRAFETSESARGRSLAELLQATETIPVSNLDPKLAQQEKSLRQSLRIKENEKMTLLGHAYKKEDVSALDAEMARLEGQYKQVFENIKERYPSYAQITRPVAWDLQQIQDQVIADDQTVLLEYALGLDKSYVWVVTRDDLKSYELPPQAQIEEAVHKVYNFMSTAPRLNAADDLIPALQELGRMVLSPVAVELNKKRIIIVADGALNYIPFQALPVSAANHELLIDKCEVINAPSASILGDLQQEAARRQPAARLLAAFGNPVFASSYALRKSTNDGEQLAAVQVPETDPLQQALRDIERSGDSFDPSAIMPLFYAKREMASLRDVAGGEETFVATDFAASRAQLLSTDLTQYAILHFATHGILNSKHPEFSGLVLSTVNLNGQAQNGFVRLQDIYGLRAPVNLVVLSACETALGKDVRGEGLLGLTRGFMYAGASTVVSSLWKVEDKATAELMKQFYANMLQKRMTPAAALRAAQNSIRQQPQWRSPYYWAAFTLQGEYRQVIKSTSAGTTSMYPKIITGATVIVLLAGLGWWYRLRRRRLAAQ